MIAHSLYLEETTTKCAQGAMNHTSMVLQKTLHSTLTSNVSEPPIPLLPPILLLPPIPLLLLLLPLLLLLHLPLLPPILLLPLRLPSLLLPTH